ncbi:MAG: DUF481 domain-containing protein [Fimbriimonadaceae bacterium]
MKSLTLSLAVAGMMVLSSASFAQTKDGSWHGGLESNLIFITSNRNSQSILIVGNVKSFKELERLFFDGYYNFGRTENAFNVMETTTDQWSFGGRFERDFGHKSFYYVTGRLERDGVNLLNLRTIFGAGLGYTVIDQEDASFRVSAKLRSVNEDYQTTDNNFWGFSCRRITRAS